MAFEPAKCPPGCAYAMQDHGDEHCGYILLAHQSRGCDPGKGCTRYRKGHMRPPTPMRVKDPEKRGKRLSDKPRKPPTQSWSVVRGREMWLEGCTNREIAQALGTSMSSVQRRKDRYWKEGKN